MIDRAETVTADQTVDAAEAAAWAELEKDVAPEEGEEQAESDGAEPEVKAEAEPVKDEKAQPPIPYEELDKRYKQLQGALGEERGTRKQLAERIQQMETVLRAVATQRQQPAQAEVKVPTIEEDPIGFFQHKLAEQERVIAELRGGAEKSVQQVQQAQVEQQFWSAVERSEQSMRQTNPDYDPAVSFLESSRVKELEAMVPDGEAGDAYAHQNGFRTAAEMRVAMLNHDRVNVSRQALAMGISPAQMYFNLALQRGYQSKPAAPSLKKATAQSTPIQAAKAGQAAAKSLSGGGSQSDNAMTPEDLAELYLEDPDRADKEFRRMQKAGLLG